MLVKSMAVKKFGVGKIVCWGMVGCNSKSDPSKARQVYPNIVHFRQAILTAIFSPFRTVHFHFDSESLKLLRQKNLE